MAITESELLDALREAATVGGDDTGASTVREIMAATGLSLEATKKRLLSLKLAGQIEPTKVRREALDGRLALVPAYRLIGKPTKKVKR